jgi:hypothetical protein
MKLLGDGFEVETLINIRVAEAGLKVKEVASYEYPRIHWVGNLNAFSDGLRVLRTILSEYYYSILSEYYYAKGRKAPRKPASYAVRQAVACVFRWPKLKGASPRETAAASSSPGQPSTP